MLAEALADAAVKRYGLDATVLHGHAKVRRSRTRCWCIPSTTRVIPIMLGDHVTTDAGTGAVHTAPGHGQEDFVVGQ
ncbi:MAG: class I tRNA ligase family protein [Arenimonas sp.]